MRITLESSVASENEIVDESLAQQHRVNYLRALALVAFAIVVLLWAASAWFVWALTAWIIDDRSDGVVPGDRAFLAWGPVTAFFLLPVVLVFAGSVVVRWRRPGSGSLMLAVGVGALTAATAGGLLFLLAW